MIENDIATHSIENISEDLQNKVNNTQSSLNSLTSISINNEFESSEKKSNKSNANSSDDKSVQKRFDSSETQWTESDLQSLAAAGILKGKALLAGKATSCFTKTKEGEYTVKEFLNEKERVGRAIVELEKYARIDDARELASNLKDKVAAETGKVLNTYLTQISNIGAQVANDVTNAIAYVCETTVKDFTTNTLQTMLQKAIDKTGELSVSYVNNFINESTTEGISQITNKINEYADNAQNVVDVIQSYINTCSDNLIQYADEGKTWMEDKTNWYTEKSINNVQAQVSSIFEQAKEFEEAEVAKIADTIGSITASIQIRDLMANEIMPKINNIKMAIVDAAQLEVWGKKQLQIVCESIGIPVSS